MRYLWNHDIRMDGTALTKLLVHEPEHTPLVDAVYATVPCLKKTVQLSANSGKTDDGVSIGAVDLT